MTRRRPPRELVARDAEPAVGSRGRGRKSRSSSQVVSNSAKPISGASLRVLHGDNEDRRSIDGIDDRVQDLLQHAPGEGPCALATSAMCAASRRSARARRVSGRRTARHRSWRHPSVRAVPRGGTGSAAASAPRGRRRSRLRHGIGCIDKLHAPLPDVCILRSITSAHAASCPGSSVSSRLSSNSSMSLARSLAESLSACSITASIAKSEV